MTGAPVDNGYMRQSWRRLLGGPAHGIARGVAVFGSGGLQDDHDQLAGLLSGCRELRDWASGHGLALDYQPASLAELDRALDSRRDEVVPLLEVEGGLYVGTVMVRHLEQARWHVWPNGHPVVRLSSGRMLDVVALVARQAGAGDLHLADLYADAA